MWIKFTFYDGVALRLRADAIDGYQPTKENGANMAITVGDACYNVKETVEQLDGLLKPIELEDNNWK